ncbi:SpoIID/LytB domain-containing protein [Desulfoscipio gibsoniae]|uniref:SpoIID/LytB domain protein n=1 Tax=Desulfoscipio gibsoniae DSM 7213 TaxID=767817 RepID=R4KHW9_9FIRM|nr:SpoIID/LytB domain-containing protein [Desulfoscipio gibsoniae]AGL01242.1 SpoIID/LytB domain protein [Desulfoscipio gibsoniae DSM 7213]
MVGGIKTKYRCAGFWMLAAFLLVVLWPGGSAWCDVQVVPQTVRVGLMQNTPQVSFVLQGAYKVINVNTGQVIAEDGEGQWTVEYAAGLCRVTKDGQDVGLYNGPIKAEGLNASVKAILSGGDILLQKESLAGLTVQGGDVHYIYENQANCYALAEKDRLKQLSWGGLNIVGLEEGGQVKRYRGNLEIRTSENYLTVINELPIEQYLYGVVPAEMPVSFPSEALKAQAVVARSYLHAQLGSYASFGFDVLDNQSNQVYQGYDGENPVASGAVDATSGMVLAYCGQPIAAFFHSSSGGFTENSEDVWFETLNFIRSKEDPYDNNGKHYDWSVTYSTGELVALINQQLKKYIPSSEFIELASITDLKELERTASGQRVKILLIEGIDAGGSPRVYTIANADRVRNVLGLRSALFTMQKQTDPDEGISGVTFNGSGSGHGLGMSQYGAAGWAGQGYSFQDILQYYYTGVELIKY